MTARERDLDDAIFLAERYGDDLVMTPTAPSDAVDAPLRRCVDCGEVFAPLTERQRRCAPCTVWDDFA